MPPVLLLLERWRRLPIRSDHEAHSTFTCLVFSVSALKASFGAYTALRNGAALGNWRCPL